MMDATFWEECAECGAVVVAFKAYSQYRDGNQSEQDYLGIRFGCVMGDTSGVLQKGDLYVAVDDALTYLEFIADTPEEALRLFKESLSRPSVYGPITQL